MMEEIERLERELQAEVLALLRRVKRDCRPEFAERMEAYMRNNDLLPPDDNACH